MPVAWTDPRVDFCYGCLPGGPFTPPPCRKCGATEDYYSAGLCQRCHPAAPQPVSSCRDCLAWGVFRTTKWLCRGCEHWRKQHSVGVCKVCARTITVNLDSVCRLCFRHDLSCRPLKCGRTRRPVAEASRYGHQLFLANLDKARLHDGKGQGGRRGAAARRRAAERARRMPQVRPVSYRQLALLDLHRDLPAGKRAGFADPPDADLEQFLISVVNTHAARHGWADSTTGTVRAGVRILLALQDTPRAPITGTEVEALQTIHMPVRPTLAVLSDAGFLDDDRTQAIAHWFERQIDGLPTPMTGELRTWFHIQRHGSTKPPRSRPRSDVTTRVNLRWITPVLRGWAADGHQSLREISREDILRVLPASGTPRAGIGSGLRSLFTVLKGQRMVFTNPLARIRTGRPETTHPLPADLDTVREALTSDDPTRAVLTALIAFHGVRRDQLRHLRLTDVHDGRLHLPGRTIPLAEPVRARLTAYLDLRAEQWPNTANPHLFINRQTAGGTRYAGPAWIWRTLGFAPRILWEDRILDEARATDGDLRRLCDLFGLDVTTARRYTSTLDHPAVADYVDAGRHR